MGQLDGKIAMVTGSAIGIGKATAIAMAREGANLVLADIREMDTTERTVHALGVQVLAVPTDVTVEPQIENLFAKTMERFGRLDVLVNNAGIFDGSPIDQLKTENWDRVIATNLRAAFLCTRAAFRIMKAQGGGRIINIGSISAYRVRPNNVAYSCCKSALIGLAQTTSLEGRKFGITAGCLHPGETLHETRPIEMQKEPALTREEVAAAAVFMACQPPDVNVLDLVILPREQLYLGRG
jgi:NAD(P)-dependent dehydrogenase (short-subunit alcohol dehydrogenase family)